EWIASVGVVAQAMGGWVHPAASPRLLRLGHRGRRLRHHGPGGQWAHGLFAALPAHPRRVWLGAGHHGRGVLLRVLRLGVPQSFCRPTDGPPWAAGGDRDGCRPYSDRVAAGPNGTPAVAP